MTEMSHPQVAASASAPAPVSHRNAALDASRGLIVALMALDHVRIYFSHARFDPVDLDATNLSYFLTRWVTHLCAPGFFFIAGLGAALQAERAPRHEVARFLLARGAWLVALELLVFGLAWSFSPGWWWFGVIAGLGVAMILLAGLLYAPRGVLLAVAGAFTLLHADLAGWLGAPGGALFSLLYGGGPVEFGPLGRHLVIYPILPWAALMILGYAAAGWLIERGRVRSGRAFAAGALAIALFILVRALGFGELGGGFAPADSASGTLMSFLNVGKYPPTLQFSLVTLGLGLVVLAALEAAPRLRSSLAFRPLLVFGRVPFFFYLLHLFLIHALAWLVAAAAGWPTDYLFWTGMGPNLVPPEGYGLPLVGVYGMWLFVLALLYPLCAGFGAYKARRPGGWIRFF